MNTNSSVLKSGRLPRWLAVAGLAITLAVPLSANADYRSDSTVEVLVSTALAYAIIDAAGGFDNNHSDHRQQSRYAYRDYHDDHHQRHYVHDRRDWARDQRRDHKQHAYKHKHAVARRCDSGHHHR